jgi:REP element-mobilizing transposase RayT
MGHAYFRNHLHVIFSTKDRRKTIARQLQPTLWRYLAGICRSHGIAALEAGGMEDHVHILLELPPTVALGRAMMLVKANSSRWMSERVQGFSWQEGYGAFAVSASNVDRVIRYIHNQEAHHRRRTFEDEFRELLRKHGVEYDPKHVFG